jgi:hypothetical protein
VRISWVGSCKVTSTVLVDKRTKVLSANRTLAQTINAGCMFRPRIIGSEATVREIQERLVPILISN